MDRCGRMCACLTAGLGRGSAVLGAPPSSRVEVLPIGSPRLSGIRLCEREERWAAEQEHPAVHRDSTALAKVLALRVVASSGIRHVDMDEIEIVRDEAGAPFVRLSGGCLQAAHDSRTREIAITLSNDCGAIAGVALPLSDSAVSTVTGGADAVLSGAGIDILAISGVVDVLQFPPGSVRRLLTEQEIERVERVTHDRGPLLLAEILAAKEAAFKALGGPLRAARSQLSIRDPLADARADFREFDIIHAGPGWAIAEAYGGMAEVIRRMDISVSRIDVVLTHCGDAVGALALCQTARRTQEGISG